MQRLFVIDGHGLVYRAYFAIKSLSTSKGILTNAVYGFINMLLKLLRDEKPEYLAVVFDSKTPTLRHEKFPQYKAQRKKMPDEMRQQIPLIMEVISAFNIPIFSMDGYEADDIIGTLVKRYKNEVDEIIVVSGDKDILQLVDEKIKVLTTKKGLSETVLYDIAGVRERFGVEPAKVTEVLAIAGDTSDNIPGIKGIGEKTAIKLIQEFGNLEKILGNPDNLSNENLRQKIKTYSQDAILSKELVTINTQVPITADLEECKVREYNEDRLFEILEKLEFKKLLKELGLYKKIEVSQENDYQIITEKEKFQTLINLLTTSSSLAIELITTSTNPWQAKIVGIAISTKPYSACYIPIAHEYFDIPEQLSKEYVLNGLKPFLESKDIKKIGHNLKYKLLVLANHGINLEGIAFDTMLASYLLSERLDRPNLSDLSDIINRACSDVDWTYQLSYEVLKPKLEGMRSLFEDMEMPLIKVLAQMEFDGIKIDIPYLKGLSQEFGQKINDLTKEIYQLADTEFNINSPKQLGFILFEKLKLPVLKKTKTGFSTDEEVLMQLRSYHPLPDKLLAYRELTKLKSTYVDALSELTDPITHRLHTCYNQTIAATGRLTSSDPNLQNIPIRTDLGNRIREAFIPEEGCLLISADYSQIELRILAHISKDERLIQAFIDNEDIHTQTAVEIFGGVPESITSKMRRAAKVVNFGITYGMSAYGLSKELMITSGQAKEMIEQYFERYPGVKGYIDKTIEEAKLNGFVTTLWGRRRYLPEINSPNRTLREFAERQAVNMPIQGTAADLIKIAMLEIHKGLDRQKARMLLQVHDELVFEVKKDSLDEVVELVKGCMEGIADFLVPIKVDIHSGENWGKI